MLLPCPTLSLPPHPSLPPKGQLEAFAAQLRGVDAAAASTCLAAAVTAAVADSAAAAAAAAAEQDSQGYKEGSQVVGAGGSQSQTGQRHQREQLQQERQRQQQKQRRQQQSLKLSACYSYLLPDPRDVAGVISRASSLQVWGGVGACRYEEVWERIAGYRFVDRLCLRRAAPLWSSCSQAPPYRVHFVTLQPFPMLSCDGGKHGLTATIQQPCTPLLPVCLCVCVAQTEGLEDANDTEVRHCST